MARPFSISILKDQFKQSDIVEGTLPGVAGGVEIRLDNEIPPIEIAQAIEILKQYYLQKIAKQHNRTAP